MKKLLLSVVFGACAVGSAYAMEEKQEETQEPTRSEPLALDDLEIPQDAKFYIEINKERFEVSRKVFGSFGVLVASVTFNKYSGAPLYQNLLALKGSKKKIMELEEQKKKVMDQISTQEGVVTTLIDAQKEPDNLMSKLQSEEMAAQKEVEELDKALEKVGLPDTEKKKITNRQNEQEKIKANSIEQQKQLRGQLTPLRIKEEEAKQKLDELKRGLNKLKKQEVIETEELRDLTKEIEKKEKARTENFNPLEIVFEWQDKTIAKHEVTLADIKTLMNFAEQGFKIEQVSDEAIPVLILLNDYLQGPQKAGEALQNALILRLKNLYEKDYSQFLKAQGFLWHLVNVVPAKILKSAHCIEFVVEPDWTIEGNFVAQLSDGRIVVKRNADVEVWEEGGNKPDWSVKGDFETQLKDGRIILRDYRNDGWYTKVWKMGGDKPDWTVKGGFRAQLPDGRIVVDVGQYTKVLNVGGNKPDWKVKGGFKAQLSDGRIVVMIYHDNGWHTEVWKMGGDKPDWTVKGEFKAQLSDGRIVVMICHDNGWHTEVWKMGSDKPDWTVKGGFKAQLSDGRIVVTVWQGHDLYTEVWKEGGNKPDWRIKGEFKAQLPDGRIVVDVDGRWYTKDTEVWKVGGKQPDLSLWGVFEGQLQDGRVVVNTSKGQTIFPITRTFGQQVLMNALRRHYRAKSGIQKQGQLMIEAIFANKKIHALFVSLSDEDLLLLENLYGQELFEVALDQLLNNLIRDVQDLRYLKQKHEIAERFNAIERILKILDVTKQKYNREKIEKRIKQVKEEIETLQGLYKNFEDKKSEHKKKD
jgi:hypothetical protein